MAPFSQSFSPPMSPDGMTVEVSSSQSASQLSPLQDPFFYANIIQRAEKSTEFRNHPPMMEEEADDHASVSSEDYEDSLPPIPKRRMSRNNFATVIQKLSSAAKPASSKKSVQFQDDSMNSLLLIQEIESHRDFSTRERNRCWWSPSEKEKCMSKHERVVSRMEHRKPCRKHETYRGLESWTSQGAAYLDQVINLCVDAVMDEQDHQWRVQKDDFERIAAISQRVTADSAKRARQVGLKDEREAMLVRNQNWVEDDEMTVQSATSASVMTAIKRKKKLTSLCEKRDPGAKKLRKKTGKSSSSVKDKDDHKHTSNNNDSSSTALEKLIHKQSSAGSTSDKASESVKSSSKKTRSACSTKSSSKKESSRSASKTRKSKSGESRDKDKNEKERASNNASLSSSKKKRSSKSSSNDVLATPACARDTKAGSLTISGTPPTSFSSSSSSLDEISPLAAAIIRQSNHKSQISQNKTKAHTTGTFNHSSDSSSKKMVETPSNATDSRGGGKLADPPGRRATRSKSSHVDNTLLTMKNKVKDASSEGKQ
ncbi:hypothetical protein IV203_010302 [Nitzschia inconspicua]|uniref:Uncharacterized protein n=1 Tax=Nitzschia inconspicua TaxID=303405 RepID=A0A9K3KW13_9STRA|nr:hypothetical protein IV203_010302 [Nitzschia inconspicua]